MKKVRSSRSRWVNINNLDHGIFQEVYPEPGRIVSKAEKDLNEFRKEWLQNMIEVQEYELVENESEQ